MLFFAAVMGVICFVYGVLSYDDNITRLVAPAGHICHINTHLYLSPILCGYMCGFFLLPFAVCNLQWLITVKTKPSGACFVSVYSQCVFAVAH